MLVTMAEMLQEAQKNNYAVPAPNVWNEESTRAALLAAENCKSPVILDYGYIPVHGRKPMVYEYMEYCERWCERSPIPIAINLDHGLQYMHAIACIRAHFTSIMVDRSALPYERNAAEVKELVKIAHSVGVSVEAELGHVGQGKRYDVDGKNNLTDPEEAARFVEETGVDCLAIAIGTAHGAYSGTPYIDFERLAQIRGKVSIPLVMHGGSGTGEENLYKAARSGISKVNLYTDLSTAGMEALRAKGIETNDISDVEIIMYKAFREKLEFYMELLGSKDQA